MKMSPFSAPFFGRPRSEGFCFQSERLLYGREPNGVRAEPGKKKTRSCRTQELARSSARENEWQKKRGLLTGKIGTVSAETCEQVKRNRKNQSRHDRHRFHNGAGFEWLLGFAAVTSGWPTIRDLSRGGSNRNAEDGHFYG